MMRPVLPQVNWYKQELNVYGISSRYNETMMNETMLFEDLLYRLRIWK